MSTVVYPYDLINHDCEFDIEKVVECAKAINDRLGSNVIDIFYDKFASDDRYNSVSLTSTINGTTINRIEMHRYNDSGYSVHVHGRNIEQRQLDVEQYDYDGRNSVINYFNTWCNDVGRAFDRRVRRERWVGQYNNLIAELGYN